MTDYLQETPKSSALRTRVLKLMTLGLRYKEMTQKKRGTVYLVGAGPGDPGLLTIKGLECLFRADVIVYDHLANRSFLEYAGDSVQKVYVGKMGGRHTMSQDKINSIIVESALKGQVVVRLKGGDPFIFGRGGEEALELAKKGIYFEVIPGISSGIAVPAYAGIPLTHRDYTSMVSFVTGHEDPTKAKSDIPWDKLAEGSGTLVFFMGVGNLPDIADNLMAHGRSGDTMTAVIRRGTLAEQRSVVGRLENIAKLVKKEGIKPPAIIVVGDVVALREKLNWFEKRPLFGKRIIVTRAREQVSGFLKGLEMSGAECIQFPTIEVSPPENWDLLDQAIESLETYQWLLFTSVNGVKFFLKRLEAKGKDVRDIKGLKIGAIGPKTAEAWHRFGIKVDLVPDEYRAEAVVECFKKIGVKGEKILLPRAVFAREVLPEELENMGLKVDVVPAYQTRRPDRDTGRIVEMLRKGEVDMVTFTSSSTVTNFADMFETDEKEFQTWMAHIAVACIGPVTAGTARDKGFSVDLIPPKYTIESFTESILDFFVS